MHHFDIALFCIISALLLVLICIYSKYVLWPMLKKFYQRETEWMNARMSRDEQIFWGLVIAAFVIWLGIVVVKKLM